MSDKLPSREQRIPGLAIFAWFRVTLMLLGTMVVLLVIALIAKFKPIADVSLLHCVNIIKEEARLTEWAGVLDLERQKMDEEQAKRSQ